MVRFIECEEDRAVKLSYLVKKKTSVWTENAI